MNYRYHSHLTSLVNDKSPVVIWLQTRCGNKEHRSSGFCYVITGPNLNFRPVMILNHSQQYRLNKAVSPQKPSKNEERRYAPSFYSTRVVLTVLQGSVLFLVRRVGPQLLLVGFVIDKLRVAGVMKNKLRA